MRALARKGQLQRGSAKATAPRLVPTSRTIDHGWMVKFVEHRLPTDAYSSPHPKWLRAGVSEDGIWSKTEVGTPQGAVASPLLANIYLHYVFDLWVRRWRKRQATGDMIVIRYADDIVLGFEHRTDAERFLQEWRDRLRVVRAGTSPGQDAPD